MTSHLKLHVKINAHKLSKLGILIVPAILWIMLNAVFESKFADLDTYQIRRDIPIINALDSENFIGQSFVAKSSYLSSVKLFFGLQDINQPVSHAGQIIIHLQNARLSDIAVNRYLIPVDSNNFRIEFSFPPQIDSLNKRYYLLIESTAPVGKFSVWSSLYDSYNGGEIYINGESLPYDLTFLTYSSPPLGDWVTAGLNQGRNRFLQLLLFTLLIFCIGLALCFLANCRFVDMIDMIVISISIGIVIPPILICIMSLTGINVNKDSLLSILIAIFIAAGVKCFFWHRNPFFFTKLEFMDKHELILLFLIFLLAAFTRVSQINDLIVPNWIDGITHQKHIEKILDVQAVSADAIYPRGFHSSVVFVNLLFKSTPQESTLLMGQWLSIISGLTFYLYARKALGPPYALFAISLFWFWGIFPAYLVNWGRYPFLEGLTLIPAAITVYMISQGRRSYLLLLGLILTGIGLIHYGSLLIITVYIVADLTSKVSSMKNIEKKRYLKYLALSIIPLLLILFVRFDNAYNHSVFGQGASKTSIDDALNALNISVSSNGWIVWPLGIFGLIFAVLFKSKKIMILARCILMLLLINFVQSFTKLTISSYTNTVIFLSIPLALFAGFTIKILMINFERGIKAIGYTGLILATLSGAYSISSITTPNTIIYTKADQMAMQWITNKTPPDSIFLINTFLWGEDRVPSDGGAWITSITNRKSTPFNPKDFESAKSSGQIDYVYIGNGLGDINLNLILSDSKFALAYDYGGIRIFKLE